MSLMWMHEVVVQPAITGPNRCVTFPLTWPQWPRNPDPETGDDTQLHEGEQVSPQRYRVCHAGAAAQKA